MALDAVFLRAVVEELRPQIAGARIEKVQQPARDQIIFLLRGNRRLLLCAGASAPRIQLTDLPRDNPAEPPMFCMLLRKHLAGGRIASLDQPPMERLVRLEIDTADDFGRPGRRTLVLEAMGRRSNLILLDEEGRVIDCLRRVDAEMSATRQVLPGLYYAPPAPGERTPIPEETAEGFLQKLSAAPGEGRADKFLLDHYFGLSPLAAREIVFRAWGDADGRLSGCGAGDASAGQAKKLWDEFSRMAEAVRENRFTPYLLRRDGIPMDCTWFQPIQYGFAVETERHPSFCSLLDAYLGDKERRERARLRGAELVRAASAARNRLQRKLSAQAQDYAATQDRDTLRMRGDLITANLYRMERGQSRLVCENFYDPAGGQAEVPLDPLLTPQQNAAKYYKRYAKAKTAEKYLTEQMAIARRDLEYLESVLEELDRAETEQDFLEIRRELRESGFLRTPKKEKKERRTAALRPREYRTGGGLRVLAGRNNRQNDALTKGADYRDLWFHVQKIHGCHVILRTEGQEPAEADVAEAAAIAAYYSQGREGDKVPVDCTAVRYVKKPAGSRPGMAVYTNYRTLYVKPALPETGEQGRQ